MWAVDGIVREMPGSDLAERELRAAGERPKRWRSDAQRGRDGEGMLKIKCLRKKQLCSSLVVALILGLLYDIDGRLSEQVRKWSS